MTSAGGGEVGGGGDQMCGERGRFPDGGVHERELSEGLAGHVARDDLVANEAVAGALAEHVRRLPIVQLLLLLDARLGRPNTTLVQ